MTELLTPSLNPDILELENGCVLLFDKPFKWTSFDVVGKVRSLLRRKLGLKRTKIGHAGTLDPLATGLLIICTGKLTKSIDQLQEMEKEYTGTFFLGQTTPSFDLETRTDAHYPVNHISQAMVEQAMNGLTGSYLQEPPLFSARKIDGERAYEIARRGEHAVLKKKKVDIREFSLSRFALPDVDFKVVCSKGTYIRAMARDLGEKLESGACLSALRRTRIGHFKADDAWDIEAFQHHILQLQP